MNSFSLSESFEYVELALLLLLLPRLSRILLTVEVALLLFVDSDEGFLRTGNLNRGELPDLVEGEVRLGLLLFMLASVVCGDGAVVSVR